MPRPLHYILRSIQVLAWLIFVGAMVLLVIEESGYLTRSLREIVAWRMGPLGAGLSIEAVDVRWFEPGLEVHGVRLADPQDESNQELIYLRKIHLSFAPSFQDQALAQVHVNGGRVVFSNGLFDYIEQLTSRMEGGESSSLPGGTLRRPPLLLSKFEVALELPSGQNLDLGQVNLAASPSGKERYSISGQLIPRLGGAVVAETPIHVRGELGPVRLDVEALGKHLALGTEGVRIPPSFGSLPVESFEGLLSLTAKGHIRFGSEFEAKGDLRGAITQARLLPRAGDPWLERLRLDVDLESSYRPSINEDIWARETWRAAARLRADWNQTPLECWAQLGRDVPIDSWARVFARAPRLPLDEAAFASLGLAQEGLGLRNALEPQGTCDASFELLLARAEEVGEEFLQLKRFSSGLSFGGESQMTFRGFVDPDSKRRIGMPIPIRELRGDALITYSPEQELPLRVTIPGATGQLPRGQVLANLGISTNPELDSQDFVLDLNFELPETDLDDSMVEVLRTSPLTSQIWEDFSPQGGRLGTRWRLWQDGAKSGVTGEGDVEVRGVDMRWAEVPVPMRNVEGKLKLRWSDRSSTSRVPVTLVTPIPGPFGLLLPSVSTLPRVHRSLGVAFEFRNDRTATEGETLAVVKGYVRSEPLPSGHEPPSFVAPGEPPRARQEMIQELSVDVGELKLRGLEWNILAERYPELQARREELKANGSLGLQIRGSQSRHGEPYLLDIEAQTLTVELTPEIFPHRTKDVRGRLLFHSDLKEESTRTRFDLYGRWAEGSEVAASGHLPPTGQAELSACAGGIDPNNSAFRGALLQVLNQDEADSGERVDMSGIALSGELDFHLTSSFPMLDPEAEPVNLYTVRLRNSRFESEDLLLTGLKGELQWSADLWQAERLEAELGGHPLEIEELMMFPLQDMASLPRVDSMLLRKGVAGGERGIGMQANISTQDLPLDVEHLSHILDDDALEPLRENQDWRGQLDLKAARLLVTMPEDKLVRVRMHGPMRVHDMRFPFGFEVQLDSADVQLSEFVAEQGGVRAWGAIKELNADLAERELRNAEMNFSLVDSRLTIDNLEGDFEGGQLVSQGAFGQGARKALGVDITPPHRFDLSLRLDRADLSRMMRGVFESSIADTGELSLNLQLAGALNDVLGLTGRGEMDLKDGRLWSIPAARELFSSLGFPNTGVFNRLQARFKINQGVFETHDLRVRSSLLKLVGTGELDFNGALSYDLDVRYGILDNLGILNKLLYWLNRGLWRVWIRGDFSRPVVGIKSSFLEFLFGKSKNPERSLPLPAFAPLGSRF